MSSVSFVTTTQPSVSVTAGKSTASQTAVTQTPPAANSSSVTISSSALYANYEQTIAEKTAWQNQVIAYSLTNPTSPLVTQNAYDMAHENLLGGSVGGIVSLAGKTPNDAISYSNGESVTVASQAYYTKQASSYMSQALELYNTEKAKGTTPGQMISDMFALKADQPAAFRAMVSWPPVAGTSSIHMASNPDGAASQYLNSAGQIVKS